MSYDYYKIKWNDTKPIRGRSEDIRPIGKRSKDKETVVRIERDGVVSYGAKLYYTVCVEYLPNGNVIIRCGGWHSPSTAKFINQHSPFACWRERGQLYIRSSGETKYPVTNEGVEFVKRDGKYVPVVPMVVQKQVVDRARARQARAPIMPFLAFAKTFLTLSDGWIMHETRKEVLGWLPERHDWSRFEFKRGRLHEVSAYDLLVNEPNEETYLYVLCHLPELLKNKGQIDAREVPGEEAVRVGTFSLPHYDYRFKFDAVKDTMYRWVRIYNDVHKSIEVTIP